MRRPLPHTRGLRAGRTRIMTSCRPQWSEGLSLTGWGNGRGEVANQMAIGELPTYVRCPNCGWEKGHTFIYACEGEAAHVYCEQCAVIYIDRCECCPRCRQPGRMIGQIPKVIVY